jgi:predicted  nucleic acid-binding Zn-ribbon protein
LRVLVVKAGKLANPPRRLPVEEEELRARLVRVEEELRASLRAEVDAGKREVDAAQRETAALRLALGAAEDRARDLVGALERERARADGAEAEVAALRSAAGLPWWRRLLTG